MALLLVPGPLMRQARSVRWTAFDSRTSPFPSLQQYLHYAPSTYPAAARDWNIFTGKVELDYKPARNTLLYASANRGAKGGGWSATSAAPVNPDLLPYDQERAY